MNSFSFKTISYYENSLCQLYQGSNYSIVTEAFPSMVNNPRKVFEVSVLSLLVPTKGPAKLDVYANGSSSLRAEWDVVPLCCRYGIIRGYQILLLDHDSREIVTNVKVSESTLSFEFHGLLAFYAYDASVAAFTGKGSGVASENGTVTGEAGRRLSLCTN